MSSGTAVSTGIKGLDKVIHGLWPGDNVVWQVDEIEDYREFARAMAGQAKGEGQRVVYMRFGQHGPLFKEEDGLAIYELDAEVGFETFSGEVHRIVSREGEGVYYIFDSLSDLLSTWATDLMTGNFFRVTCPYLYELNTIAYFGILRNRISNHTIARIRETTQLFLDIHRHQEDLFVHPIKVFNRYSPTMYLPHLRLEDDSFLPVTSSVQAATLFSRFKGPGNLEGKLDYWDRVFLQAQELVNSEAPGLEEKKQAMLGQLCKMLIGKDPEILELARKYFSLEDLLQIRTRLIGSGYIGGKTVGMLLARKILSSRDHSPWHQWLEAHDSFYIGSDLYYTYLVENGCWQLRMKQKEARHFFSSAPSLKEKILKGLFPNFIKEQLYQLLDYFGQAPIIVRSSSLLEDGFGNAFAGKYESVFCVNQGTLGQRYEALEQALKTIYASTMSEDALAYRMQRGLDDRDEQMALLVQRVSGSHHSQYFFPDLAGVAMSFNPYIWREDIQAEAGMMRLVLGLGTRAVDRVEDDYPRVMALDQPQLRPDGSREELRVFSQHQVDVLDSIKNQWGSIPLQEIPQLQPQVKNWPLMAVPDHEQTRRRKELGLEGQAWLLTFDGLINRTPFIERIKLMLQELQRAYNYPVDTEFTCNFLSEEEMHINLLQCRPLQTLLGTQNRRGGENPPGELLFATRGRFMGLGAKDYPEKVIIINPGPYLALSQQDKYQAARIIGYLNRAFKGAGGLALIGPGRWGSSIPSLGIPVSFSEICNCSVLVEVAVKEQGLIPELSFGTHFFQDLVETQIFYAALFPGDDGVVFRPDLLQEKPNQLGDLLPDYARFSPVIQVLDLSSKGRKLLVEVDLATRQAQAYLTSS